MYVGESTQVGSVCTAVLSNIYTQQIVSNGI